VRLTPRPRQLRGRIALSFALGALLLSTSLATFTFLVARGYLLDQRQRTAIRQTYLDGTFLRTRLATPGSAVAGVLATANPPRDGAFVVRRDGKWYSTTLGVDPPTVPAALQQQVQAGRPGYVLTTVNQVPALVVGLPLSSSTQFYRVAPLTELDDTLRTLSTVLAVGAGLATAAGAILGGWASGKVTRPLNLVAATAAQIAGGHLDTRLPNNTDPDLAIIVGSFNTMVDSLQQRVERDARFAADVGHELRSPLTTLVASVELLGRHRDELSPRAVQAIDLVAGDLTRLQHLLDNLLHLAKADAGLDLTDATPVPLHDLLHHTLVRGGHPADLLHGDRTGEVRGDKFLLERAFANLIDNADRHGGGLRAVTIQRQAGKLLVLVDDDGPGVPLEDRERIFDRFATSRSARRSSSGTGLGLALAAQTLAAHHGALWCTDGPGQGARFVASLPAVAS
jgi:two-component system sensor histidine kinase MtrB